MKRIGLTGNLATGKSTIAGILADHGVTVIDSDTIAHTIIAPHTHTWKSLFERYGKRILLPDGVIDRRALAEIIFGNAAEKKFLEGLIHPHVKDEIGHRIAQFEKKNLAYVIVEVPLLYEVKWESSFDLVVVAVCSEKQALERAQKNLKLTHDEALQRWKQQWPMDKKSKKADVVIDTSGTLEETRVQVERLYHRWERGDFSKQP